MSELHPHELLARLEKGTLDESLQSIIAQGLLPLPLDELLPLIVGVANKGKDEWRKQAKKTLEAYPPSLLLQYCQDAKARGEVLAYFLENPLIDSLLPPILNHPHTPTEALKIFAQEAKPEHQELLLQQIQRIVEHPEILDALEENPQLTPASRGRIKEIRFHYFGEAPPEEAIPEEVEEEEEEVAPISEEAQALFDEFGVEPIEDNLFSEIAIPDEELETEEEKTIYQKILTMTVPQKIDLALKGDKEARSILIRDSNKLVQAAVIKSPKLTDGEAAAIAAMRSLDTELLRYITQQRQWMRKYQVVKNLVFNPKTPIGEALTLMNKLNKRDLKELSRDKGVPDVVRTAAMRLYRTRMSANR